MKIENVKNKFDVDDKAIILYEMGTNHILKDKSLEICEIEFYPSFKKRKFNINKLPLIFNSQFSIR